MRGPMGKSAAPNWQGAAAAGRQTRRRAAPSSSPNCRTETQPAHAEAAARAARGRTSMEVADSPVKDDAYSDVGSDDNYDDDFGEAEAPPDPIATPVAENDYEDDFGVDDRGYDAKQEDKYADDFVEDKDDLSIVDDDADSEEDEFEKGLQAAEAAAQQKKLEAQAKQEEEASQSDYGDDFASLNPSEKSEPQKRPPSAVVKRKPKRPTVDKAPSPQAPRGPRSASLHICQAVVATLVYQTRESWRKIGTGTSGGSRRSCGRSPRWSTSLRR